MATEIDAERWGYSSDEVGYFGKYATEAEAVGAGIADLKEQHKAGPELSLDGFVFWVGKACKPPSPSNYFHADDWLENAGCSDEYSGEWAEDWDQSTAEQKEELESEVRAVMEKWMDKHDLHPSFYNVDDPIEYVIENGVGVRAKK